MKALRDDAASGLHPVPKTPSTCWWSLLGGEEASMSDMRRREFITLARRRGGVWSLAAASGCRQAIGGEPGLQVFVLSDDYCAV
jgi:hypothetical protein